jgi:hypothetical protein
MNASSGAIASLRITDPFEVGMSTVSTLSLRRTGTPWSGPRGPLAFRSTSNARAMSIAFGFTAMIDPRRGPPKS